MGRSYYYGKGRRGPGVVVAGLMVFLAGLAVVGGQLENDQPSPPMMVKGWSGEKPAALSDVRPGGGPKWDAEGRKNVC